MGGTNTLGTLAKHYNSSYDRVVILTDEAHDMPYRGYYGSSGRPKSVSEIIPSNVPLYTFNLAGYATTVVDPDKQMYEFGGLTDNTFKMINALEQGRDSNWPWDQ